MPPDHPKAPSAAGSYEQRIKEVSPELGMPRASLLQLDEQYRRALALALESGRASVSMIQRRLNISYMAAQQLVVRMLRDGFVSVEETPGVPAEMAWGAVGMSATPCKPGTRCSRSIRGLGGCEAGSCEREEGAVGVDSVDLTEPPTGQSFTDVDKMFDAIGVKGLDRG